MPGYPDGFAHRNLVQAEPFDLCPEVFAWGRSFGASESCLAFFTIGG